MLFRSPARGGDDVHLTLDSRIQDRLERELDAAVIRCKAESAMGLLMDPKTGAILALACRPAFNPNEIGRASCRERV